MREEVVGAGEGARLQLIDTRPADGKSSEAVAPQVRRAEIRDRHLEVGGSPLGLQVA